MKFFVTDFLTKTFSELLSFVHNVSLVFWAHRGDGETKHQQRQQHICWCRWSSYDTGECPLVQNISHLWNKYSSHIFIVQKSSPVSSAADFAAAWSLEVFYVLSNCQCGFKPHKIWCSADIPCGPDIFTPWATLHKGVATIEKFIPTPVKLSMIVFAGCLKLSMLLYLNICPGLPHLLQPGRPWNHTSFSSHLPQHCNLQTGR